MQCHETIQNPFFPMATALQGAASMTIRRGLLAILMLSLAKTVLAASFIVPTDRELVRQASAIVIASALASRAELDDGHIVTITTMSIEDVIKGDVANGMIEVYEPGGSYKDRVTMIPGVPRFNDGDRYLLFLIPTRDGRWHVLDLVLGKFSFATDTLGHDVVVRDIRDVLTLESNGSKHEELNRAAQPFIEFIRQTAKGGPTTENYTIPAEHLIGGPSLPQARNSGLKPINLTTFTATSYTVTFTTEGGMGPRWCGTVVLGNCTVTFPLAVTFRSIGSEPGAGGSPAGADAINAAINAWNTGPGANINYAYGGNDASGTTNAPNSMTGDGKNTIAFEYDLSMFGPPFSCMSGGLLGLGGISATSGTHTGPNSESFYTTTEGDVWMNQGIANCTALFSSGDFNSAVTHEVGHTLGFRHADRNRLGSMACSTDVLLECATSAIMTATVTNGLNGSLQAWDQHAAAAVYPGVAPPSPVTAVEAHATTSTSVQVSWSGLCATTCHVYRSSDRVTYTQVGSSATSPFNDSPAPANAAYLYKVRAFNGTSESADSNTDLATTVIFTDDPLVVGSTAIKAVHLTELRTAVDAVRKLSNNGVANPYSYGDPTITPQSTLVRATHINDLRTALDQAMGPLGLATGGYTDTITPTSTLIKAVHFQELRNRVK